MLKLTESLKALFCVIITTFICSAVSYAADYDVSKLVYQLTPQAPIDTAVITNNRDTPIFIQIKIKKRDRKNGKDVLSDTKDIITSPPIVKLAPKQAQTIRIVMHRSFSDQELMYRMIVNDISPQPQYTKVKVKNNPGINISINFKYSYVLSVYAAPIKYQRNYDLSIKHPNNKLNIALKNTGNATLHITKIVFADPNSDQTICETKKGATIFMREANKWSLKPSIKLPNKVRMTIYLEDAPKLVDTISIT